MDEAIFRCAHLYFQLGNGRKQNATKRRTERAEYLAKLVTDLPRVWQTVQGQVARGSGLAYDEACGLLVDLAEACALHASAKAFQEEFQRFTSEHHRRKSLLERLKKAGLPHPTKGVLVERG